MAPVPPSPPPRSAAPEPGDLGPARVRIVLADVARTGAAGHTRGELTQQSQVGEALVRGLVRAQLAVALRLAALVAVGLGGLPLLFAVAPMIAEARLFGVALPWLLLGVGAYPFLFAVGCAYVYLAERTEQEFSALVDRKSG